MKAERQRPRSVSRRRFLSGIAVLLAGPFAVRCGGAGGPAAPDIEARARTYDTDLDCSDAKGLWPAELATRTDNEYRDRSTERGQYCFVCNNYEKPKVAGTCAGCTTVKGPIHPLGWCKAWTEKL